MDFGFEYTWLLTSLLNEIFSEFSGEFFALRSEKFSAYFAIVHLEKLVFIASQLFVLMKTNR